MSYEPAALLSCVRFDDNHEDGRLRDFREHLRAEVRVQTGDEFTIFPDRQDIAWSRSWRERLQESLDAVSFLVAILTPSYFNSSACRQELQQFIECELRLNRNDLIIPVYYVNCAVLNEAAKREADPLAKAIVTRQYADWRELRFEPFTSPLVRKSLAKMATQIAEALQRGEPAPNAQLRATVNSGGILRGSVEFTDQMLPPRRKIEPPTRVVDALNRGDHLTLTEALMAANPGDRILVRPGLYQEGIVIDKPVEIIGDGDLGDVVIEATGKNAVLFKASMGRIANLTLRQTGSGDWYCLDIAEGRLDLDGCDITSQSLACVAIHGGADPRLRRNRIHDGEQGGVYVYDNGEGTLEDNDIHHNTLAGVAINTGGNPTLRRNRIHGGVRDGVYVYDDGLGTLEDNDIFDNGLPCVAIRTRGNPILRRNRIYGGAREGVYVGDNGQGTLEDNDIHHNKLAGVAINTGGNPTVRKNRIRDGNQEGIFAWNEGQGTMENNDIYGNAFAGVAIKAGSNLTLRRNRIRDGKREGVFVDNGQGTLEDNEIFGNAFVGVEIRNGGNLIVRLNRISKNASTAIYVHDDAGGVFEENDLRGNKEGAWNISDDCLHKVSRDFNQE